MAFKGLRDEARTVQRGGLVRSSLRIIDHSRVLREEMENLLEEVERQRRVITISRAEEGKLQQQITELRSEIDELGGWPVPPNIIVEPSQ
jgi:coenzyme F420-reducing hydrogenase delta subunit